MKTAFIGGGRGCLAVLEMYERGRLGFLGLEILAVVDVRVQAPALAFARKKGWKTFSRIGEALALPGLQLVIELTGSDRVLERIYRERPEGVRVLDHDVARLFWELEKVTGNLKEQLRKKSDLEERLASDRAELQEILDTIPDAVVVVERDRSIRRANLRFEQLTRIPRQELRGSLLDEVFSDPHTACEPINFLDPFRSVMDSGSPAVTVHTHDPDKGDEQIFQVSANPILDRGGNVVRVVEASREVTEQVRLKRETVESARRFRQITDAVHGIITIRDQHGRFQVVNPRAEKVFGLAEHDMVGKTVSEVFPPGVARVIESNDRAATDRGGHHTTEDVLTLSGRERALISERFPLRDYKGAMVGLCWVARDESRRRRLQQELLQTEKLAAIGKLAAGVAHEVNNPLSGILTFAEDLLVEAGEDDPCRDDYRFIVNEALRCRRIVRDLLEFARQRTPERERRDVNGIVRRVLSMVERQASFQNISFVLELEESLPESWVDPHQLQQALLNLVINARDAMDHSGVVTIHSGRADGGRSVVLAVTDSGCGIPREKLDSVFEPFYSTKGDLGHGIGLAGVRNVVEHHGGRVEVESEVGRGSTFRLILPAAE